jgi:hypothetical protein
MDERKQKQAETEELDMENSGFTLQPSHVEVGSGYTLQIKYDHEQKPIVSVKTYGKVDLTKIRREINRIFPNAQIRQLGQPGTVTVVKADSRKIHRKKKRT